MSTTQPRGGTGRDTDSLPNGPAAAAILAAGIGCGAVGILAFAGDASDSVGRLLNIYNPTGTLSGVTTLAIIIWLVAWFALNRLWRTRNLDTGGIYVAAFALLAVGFLLTFPPFMDLLQGK
ncbi:MAG TPA: hypothetical protein VKI44_42875 [Acetobacteraceae bacterium]|nr:hypothetical protein [Acetobacteraceae bacterium]